MIKFHASGLRKLLAAAALCLAPSLFAQFTTVVASHAPGTNATAYWQAIVPARIGSSSGQLSGMPLSVQLSSGSFSLVTADALLSSPNTCYAVTIVDNTSGSVLLGAGLTADGHVAQGGAYGCVQPSGSTWNFDAFSPPATPPAVNAPIPGMNWRGTWSNLSSYNLHDGVYYNGASYISTINGNTNTPGTTGWDLMAAQGSTAITGLSGDGAGNATQTGRFTAHDLFGGVNGTLSVTSYGAIADCTRTGSNALCTNNNTAFTNAVAAGLPAHQALYLPVNPLATGETTYYVCPAVDTKGLSIYAQPGGWGLGSAPGYAYPINIRGCASNDVLKITPATAYPTYTWEGFNIIVDDSVDVSASNTTRRPGRQCHDVVANGTTIITSALQCNFQQGDAGQAITVGAQTGTIASVQSIKQATVSFSATAGTSVAAYISVLGLAVTQNIGNCGVAIEDATGTSSSLAPAAILRDVAFATTTNTGNHTCAWLTQGNAALYNSEFDYVNTAGSTFGFMFIPSASGATNGTIYAGLGDRNRWVHNWLNNSYPFLAYDGGLDSLIDTQINGEIYGPTILPFNGVRQLPESWAIDLPEVESAGQHCTAGSNWFRLSGVRHVIDRLYGPFCPETTNFIWDAAYSQAKNVNLGSINLLEISGDQSELTFTGQLGSPASVSITGRGTRAIQCSNFSNLANTTPGRCSFYSQSASRSAIAFDRRSDFGRTAGTDDAGYYFSDEGLWMWPTEIGCSTCGYAPPLVADSTARTGQTIDTTGSNSFTVDVVNGSSLTISSSTVAGHIPAKKMRVYVRHKASTTISGAYFTVGANGSNSNLCVNNTITLTTAWSVDSCDIDATSFAGDSFSIQIGQSGSANHIYTDYIRIRPVDDDTLTNKLTETLFTPASSSAACSAGQVAEDANYHYVCTAANTWKRVALTTF